MGGGQGKRGAFEKTARYVKGVQLTGSKTPAWISSKNGMGIVKKNGKKGKKHCCVNTLRSRDGERLAGEGWDLV